MLKTPEKDNIIYRDYSLSQQQDYSQNILPYINAGYNMDPIGSHRYGFFVVEGWKIIESSGRF
jgi:hypothetical protein